MQRECRLVLDMERSEGVTRDSGERCDFDVNNYFLFFSCWQQFVSAIRGFYCSFKCIYIILHQIFFIRLTFVFLTHREILLDNRKVLFRST
jgi:hypothetical protein